MALGDTDSYASEIGSQSLILRDHLRKQAECLSELLEKSELTVEQIIGALKPKKDDIVYISGSTFNRVGDAASDIDVYVLKGSGHVGCIKGERDNERVWQQIRRNFYISYIDVNRTQLDVEYHPLHTIKGMFSTLADLDPKDPRQIEAHFDSLGVYERGYALDLLSRYRIGCPIYNKKAFLTLLRDFPEEQFRRWNVEWNVINADDWENGTRRSLRGDDGETALLKLRLVADYTADALLFNMNRGVDRWKWRLAMLRNCVPIQFLGLYKKIHFEMHSVSTDDILEHLSALRRWREAMVGDLPHE